MKVISYFILSYIINLSRRNLKVVGNFVNSINYIDNGTKGNKHNKHKSTKIPSYYKARQTVTDSYPIKPKNYDICPRGCMLFEGDQEKCSECGRDRFSTNPAAEGKKKANVQMAVLTVSSQVSLLVYNKKTRDLLLPPPTAQTDDMVFGDFFTGSTFKSLQIQHDSMASAIYIGIYIDGFAPLHRPDHSLVLVHMVIFNFHWSIRYKNSYMLDYCIFPGPASPKKAHYWTFLKPLLLELENLEKHGIKVLCDDGKERRMNVYCIFMTGDLPGVSPLACHSGHSSSFPCRICTVSISSLTPEKLYDKYIDPLSRWRLRCREDFEQGSEVSNYQCYPTHSLLLAIYTDTDDFIYIVRATIVNPVESTYHIYRPHVFWS